VGASSDDVLVDGKKDVFVPKEDSSLYVPNLVPLSTYTFNISAKFLDGSYGPAYSIRLNTGDFVSSHTAAPSRADGLYLVLLYPVSADLVNGHSRAIGRMCVCVCVCVCLNVRMITSLNSHRNTQICSSKKLT